MYVLRVPHVYLIYDKTLPGPQFLQSYHCVGTIRKYRSLPCHQVSDKISNMLPLTQLTTIEMLQDHNFFIQNRDRQLLPIEIHARIANTNKAVCQPGHPINLRCVPLSQLWI